MNQAKSIRLPNNGMLNVFDHIIKNTSERALGISAFSALAGIVSKLEQNSLLSLGMIVGSLANITLVLSFIIALFTVAIKAKEFVVSYLPYVRNLFKWKKKTKKNK